MDRERRTRRASRALTSVAKGMRRSPTDAEARLWAALRDRQVGGLKFRRQHALGRFVADFYCARARLVVEVDGAVHASTEQAVRDAERAKALEQLGLRILRVSNADVQARLPQVLDTILAAAASD